MTASESKDPHATGITFTVTLDSIRITDTRALHQDTDYVTFTLLLKSATASGTPQTLRKSLGDVNNGTITVGLSFPNLQIDPSQTLIFNYLILNSGYMIYNPGNKGEREVESLLETAGNALAAKGLVTGGTQFGLLTEPGLGSLLPDPGGVWLAVELRRILGDGSCDGFVAAEQVTLTYNDLLAKTAGGPYQHETTHPGTDSATGCGRNSMYYVDWHVAKRRSIPTGPIKGDPVLTGPLITK
jgi:hypothetical protein